jgi:hypothetical protein
MKKSEGLMKLFVLLQCWNDGDGYFHTDGFEAAGKNICSLAKHAKKKHPDCEIYLPGQDVPDNGHDAMMRYRIKEVEILD